MLKLPSLGWRDTSQVRWLLKLAKIHAKLRAGPVMALAQRAGAG